jgi:hypothetical protein
VLSSLSNPKRYPIKNPGNLRKLPGLEGEKPVIGFEFD